MIQIAVNTKTELELKNKPCYRRRSVIFREKVAVLASVTPTEIPIIGILKARKFRHQYILCSTKVFDENIYKSQYTSDGGTYRSHDIRKFFEW
jgi:hypothetical protein